MAKLIAPSLAFIIASNPETFRVSHKVLGPWVSSAEGIATPAGVLVHTLVLIALTVLFRFLLTMIAPQISFKGGHQAATTSERCTCPDGFYYSTNMNPGGRCIQSGKSLV